MNSAPVSPAQEGLLDRVLALEMVRITEAAAIAAAAQSGRGDERAADEAAVEAMRKAFDLAPIKGTVVIGEGERDNAPMLYVGEKVGGAGKDAPEVDIAVDPLEGTTITAKAGANALAVLAIAGKGCLLNAPDIYMEKLAVGPGYPEGVIDLDCQVFNYPGLFVADNSIIPANPGVNPSLTCTALAEYAMSRVPPKPGFERQRV